MRKDASVFLLWAVISFFAGSKALSQTALQKVTLSYILDDSIRVIYKRCLFGIESET